MNTQSLLTQKMSEQPPWRFALLTFGCKVNQYESQALREAWATFGGIEVPYNLRSLNTAQSLEALTSNAAPVESTQDIATASALSSASNSTSDFIVSSKSHSPPFARSDTSGLPHIIILNTCAVTAEAVADVRQTVLRIRRTCSNVAIALVGCAVSAEQELIRTLPEVDCIVPQAQKAALLQNPLILLDAIRCQAFQSMRTTYNNRNSKAGVPQSASGQSVQTAAGHNAVAFPDNGTVAFPDNNAVAFPDNKAVAFPSFSISNFTRARPVLKVQDGCAQACTYCIVPLARGRSRSRPFDAILAEAKRLLHSGAREIMISGINLREYHAPPSDTAQNTALKNAIHANDIPLGDASKNSASFWGMLKRLDAALAPNWQGLARLRISSLDPAQLNDEGLDTLANTRLVCPHVHLSLQSGSQAVLRRMGRTHYKPECIIEAVKSLTQHWPIMGLGADLLMGFAGEDQNALEESLALVTALPLSYAHVFAYSERPRTVAASFTDHLPKNLRQEHARQMRTCVAQKRQAFLERTLQMPCLMVAPDGADSVKGVDAHYIPCYLEKDVKPFIGKGLQAVRPVKYAKEGLVVTTIME